MKTRLLLVALLAGVVQPSDAQAPNDDARTVLKRLEGEWRVVAVEMDGMQGEVQTVARFAQARVTMLCPPPERSPEFTLTIDPSKSPAWLDHTTTSGKEPVTYRGIYELKGDTLRVVSRTDPAGARPAAFRAPKGSGLVMYTYQRLRAI